MIKPPGKAGPSIFQPNQPKRTPMVMMRVGFWFRVPQEGCGLVVQGKLRGPPLFCWLSQLLPGEAPQASSGKYSLPIEWIGQKKCQTCCLPLKLPTREAQRLQGSEGSVCGCVFFEGPQSVFFQETKRTTPQFKGERTSIIL